MKEMKTKTTIEISSKELCAIVAEALKVRPESLKAVWLGGEDEDFPLLGTGIGLTVEVAGEAATVKE